MSDPKPVTKPAAQPLPRRDAGATLRGGPPATTRAPKR